MNTNQAVKRLKVLGFTMSKDGVKSWGSQTPEPFDPEKNDRRYHILSPPFRDVFFGQCNGGWYVTSSIIFSARIFRCRNKYTARKYNIFGGGKTLEEAMLEFEVNFRVKKYNVSRA
jgi:hypothetical protein